MNSLLQLVILIAALASCSNAVKLSPEMEKCAEQLLRALPKETNAVYKNAITKIMKDVNAGALAEAQKTVKSVPEPDRSACLAKYMVADCLPMQSCLDCPIDLSD
ncbi:hypothetical protein PRIPAC_82653 [Pristionchus pacificus]|uniref:Uncharacterized protein n=1 Tax=Pristionchus pacificus TaxID=54126 RepID=A0A2A6CLV7_PRIPA|nr:hypothetical protein PRIPAC_82653 [Pristionchus pacificus]|eukprot:PDM79078.1 hypothetical protein PRIPAC_31657 [Pristionchus pacificus]